MYTPLLIEYLKQNPGKTTEEVMDFLSKNYENEEKPLTFDRVKVTLRRLQNIRVVQYNLDNKRWSVVPRGPKDNDYKRVFYALVELKERNGEITKFILMKELDMNDRDINSKLVYLKTLGLISFRE